MKKFLLVIWLSCSFLSLKSESLDEHRQAFIREFVEYYRQSYQKENISFIERIFSGDALILTETKQLIPIGSEIIPNSTKKRPYHTLVDNRKTYIAKLKEYFKKADRINIGIPRILVKQHPKYPEIYGVNFFQVWDDSGGNNILENNMPGYVFMMIDFRNSETEPTILVRTWQPKKNILQPSDKYNLTDFRILDLK